MPPEQLRKLKQERAATVKALKGLIDRAEAENRDLNGAETKQYDEGVATIDALDKRIERGDQMAGLFIPADGGTDNRRAIGITQPGEGLDGPPPAAAPSEWRTRDNRPVYELNERRTAAGVLRAGGGERLSLGHILRAMWTGNKRDLTDAESRALAEGVNTSGGYLVPEAVAAEIIDLARASSIVMQSGARTVLMPAEMVRIPRVTADPAVGVKAENALINEADVTFDSVNLRSRTLATMVRASRELIEDGVGVGELIQRLLATAMEQEIDRLALVGQPSDGIEGVTVRGDVPVVDASVGALEAWDDVLAAHVAVQNANHAPSGLVTTPDIAGALAGLKSGDGANASLTYIDAPAVLRALPLRATTKMTAGTLAVGDWSQVVIGVRAEPTVEATTTADGTFERHQFAAKCVWRGDVAVAWGNAFALLKGITTA